MHNQIKESDWKVFKELRPLALQRYCERLMGDVNEIIRDSDKDAYDRYSKMYKIVRDGDKKLADMFDGFSRSRAFTQLLMYYEQGLMTEEEIDQLSDETRERIRATLKHLKGK